MFETTNQYIYNYEWNSTYVHSHKIVSIAIWCDMFLHLFSTCKLGLAMEDCHVHCILHIILSTNQLISSFIVHKSLSLGCSIPIFNNSGWIIAINEPENDWNNAVWGWFPLLDLLIIIPMTSHWGHCTIRIHLAMDLNDA